MPFLNFCIIHSRDDVVRCFHTDPITYPISGIDGEVKHRISCNVGYDRDGRHTWQFRFYGMKSHLMNLPTVVIDITLDGILLACNSFKNALDWYRLPHFLQFIFRVKKGPVLVCTDCNFYLDHPYNLLTGLAGP